MHIASPPARSPGLLVAVGLLAALLVACQADTDVHRFTQTWEEPLEETSCQQWADDMTGSQRYAASAEFLLDSRGDQSGFPSDGQFAYFLSRMDIACADAGEALVSDTASRTFAEFETRLTSNE